MNGFQVVIHKAKSAGRAVSNKVGGGWRYVAGRARAGKNAVVTKATTTTIGKRTVATVVKRASAAFGLAVAVEVITRFIQNPRSIKKLWTDWRNNPRRLVSVLWSALMLTVSFYVLVFAWKYLLVLAMAFVVACMLVSVAWDLLSQVKHPVMKNGLFKSSENLERENGENVRRRYAPARFGVSMFALVMILIPFKIADYTPEFISNYVAPAYSVQVEKVKASEVETEETEAVNTEQVNDTGATPVQEEPLETVLDTEEEKIKVVVDGDAFAKNPRAAGVSLAHGIEHDGGNLKEYRRQLKTDLQKAGLNGKQVTLGMSGYDSVLNQMV